MSLVSRSSPALRGSSHGPIMLNRTGRPATAPASIRSATFGAPGHEPGAYELRIDLKGYEPLRLPLNVQRGVLTDVEARLAPVR